MCQHHQELEKRACSDFILFTKTNLPWDIDKQRQAEFISYHLSRQNKETGFVIQLRKNSIWSSLGNMNEAKWCYLGIMNFYLNEGMNIASKRKQVYHLVKPKYIFKNKDMLAIQCQTFLMTAYYNDSCNFKMSIDFCLLNAWLILSYYIFCLLTILLQLILFFKFQMMNLYWTLWST